MEKVIAVERAAGVEWLREYLHQLLGNAGQDPEDDPLYRKVAAMGALKGDQD